MQSRRSEAPAAQRTKLGLQALKPPATSAWEDFARQLPVGVHVYQLVVQANDFTFRIVEANREADRLVGPAGGTAAGLDLDQAFPEIRCQGLLPALAEVVRSGQTLEVSDVRFTADSRQVFDLKAFALPGERLGILFEDTTERRRVEEALLQLGWQQEAMLKATDEGIIGFEPDGRITFANPSAARLLGYAAHELVGLSVWSLMRGAGGKLPAGSHTLKPAVWHVGESFIGRDGRLIPVACACNPVLDRGVVTGAVLAFRDVSEVLAMQSELIAARDLAEEASRAKSLFLANMSHELRTPLNAIIGYAELLLEEAREADDSLATDLERIRYAGRHLLGLVNDILDLSKIEAGKVELYVEPCELESLVGAVVDTLAPALSQGHNVLETQLPAGLPLVQLDVGKLRQILLNVLSNACKFTSAGHIRLEARAVVEAETCWLTFELRDEGIGMSPSQVANLFQAFSQADAGTTRKYGGTGLGLALSRRLCQLMGGDISVTSELGRGSCFTVRLPARLAPAAPESLAALATPRAAAQRAKRVIGLARGRAL